MSSSSSVLAEAMQLPRGERAEIARELLASLDDPGEASEPDVGAAWLAEAERRMKDVEQGGSAPVAWDAMHERIAARLRAVRR